mmetsp:Transcript_7160/g.44453  ORF Transcript_7160/g.44453 Transcript_7160/m.44453 type:complete len:202 (+) Transcript_7160:3273-3878(+)
MYLRLSMPSILKNIHSLESLAGFTIHPRLFDAPVFEKRQCAIFGSHGIQNRLCWIRLRVFVHLSWTVGLSWHHPCAMVVNFVLEEAGGYGPGCGFLLLCIFRSNTKPCLSSVQVGAVGAGHRQVLVDPGPRPRILRGLPSIATRRTRKKHVPSKGRRNRSGRARSRAGAGRTRDACRNVGTATWCGLRTLRAACTGAKQVL